MAHLRLDGGKAETVDASLNITGDIDLRVRVAIDNYAVGGEQNLLTKWSGASQRSYRLLLTSSGTAQLRWSTTGTSVGEANFFANPSLTGGEAYWLRATLDVDNGDGGHEGRIWIADGSLVAPTAEEFSPVDDPTVGEEPTSIFEGSAPVVVGDRDAPSAPVVGGIVHRAQIFDGIDGTLVFDADFSDPTTWAPDRQSITEKANGATVTLQGDARLVRPLGLLLGVG